VILDCGYGATIPEGRPVSAGARVDILQQLGGRGRLVLTASDGVQYTFEGDRLHGVAEPSGLTRHLVQGLRDGSADLDGDGDIGLAELCGYVRAKVAEERPNRPPKLRDEVEGPIV